MAAVRTHQQFAAEGRLAVKAEGEGSYANFDWTYQPLVETININTPLGSTLGQLCQDRDGALAVDGKGNVYQAESAEELSRQLVGFKLPINICISGQMAGVWRARLTASCRTAYWNNTVGLSAEPPTVGSKSERCN